MRMRKFDKFKKILAGILSTTMVLSSMVVTGVADTKNTTDAIDGTKEVSLTITRYKDSGSGTLVYTTGTGEKISEVPAGAVAVSGVTYNVWKIANISQAKNASGVYEMSYDVLSEYQSFLSSVTTETNVITDADSAEAIYEALKEQTSFGEAKISADTDVNGKVQFDNLSDSDTDYSGNTARAKLVDGQGLYLVVEDPDSTDEFYVAPFLVSLPTTVDSVASAGSEWIYDVYAYPKTTRSTGDITIKKYGVTAGQEEAGKAYLGGIGDDEKVEFYIQKHNGGGGDEWLPVADNEGTNIHDGIVTISNKVTGVKISGLSSGRYRLVEKTAPKGYIIDGTATYEFTVDTYGRTTGSSVKESSEYGNLIEIKNEKPSVEKEVLSADGASYGETADYTTGDDVTFKITATVPTNVAKLTTYKIVDEFDKTQFDTVSASTVTIKYYDADGAEITGIEAKDSFAANDASADKGGWTLELKKDVLRDNNVATIEVIFKAKLLNSAVTADEGNINTGKVEYTNHIYPDSTEDTMPNKEDDPGYEERTEITDQAGVYTFGFDVEKEFKGTDKDANEKYAAGFMATFDLYRAATSDEITAGTAVTAGGVANLVKIATYTTDEYGKISVNTANTDAALGLKNGTYYLVETNTADGYNLLEKAVPVTISVSYSGKVYAKTITVNKYNNTGDLIGTITETETVNEDDVAGTTYTGGTTVTVKITNKKGFTFPQTGGTGTIIFTIIGLILMIGGVSIYFTARKRKYN